MLCKGKSKGYFIVLAVIGIISFTFGILSTIVTPEDAHNLSMLAGMFTGLGAAFVTIGLVQYIRNKISSPEKLRTKEIEKTDERNIQVIRAAAAVAMSASYIIFAILAFTFVALDYRIPAFITIGAMYVEFTVYLISYRILNNKM